MENLIKGRCDKTVFAISIIISLCFNLGISIYLGLGEVATGLGGAITGNHSGRIMMFFVSALILGIIDLIALIFVVRRGNDSGSTKILSVLWIVGMVLDIMNWKILFFIRPIVFYVLTLIVGITKPSLYKSEIA